MRHHVLLPCVLLFACGPDFDEVTTVKDLRVISVGVEPPQILLDRFDVAAPLRLPVIELRPLVLDPAGAGRPVEVSVTLCGPDTSGDVKGRDRGAGNFRDTIARGRCDNQAATAPLLPVPGVTAGRGGMPLVARFEIGVDQLLAATGVDPQRLAGIEPKLVVPFGFPLRFQIHARAGDEEVFTVKRVDLHPRLEETQQPNQSPVITRLTGREKKEDLAIPLLGDQPWTVKLGSKLIVAPEGATAERYAAMTFDRDLGRPTLRSGITEVLRYSFFASQGKFSPAQVNTEPEVVFTNAKTQMESTYEAPKTIEPGQPAEVDVWVVVRDERAGQSFVHTRLLLAP